MKRMIPFLMKTLGLVFPGLIARWAFDLFLRPVRHLRPAGELDFWNRGEPLTMISGVHARKYGAGPCVWFVPGWEGRGTQFTDMAEKFLKAGFSVLLWEGPGHGDTPGKRTHMIQMAELLEKDLRSQVDAPYALIGHSFGGAVSALVAGRNILTPYVIIIEAPVEIFRIFKFYWERIQLPARARKVFLELAEKEVGLPVHELNIAEKAKTYRGKFLLIYDQDDKEVSFENLAKFQSTVPEAQVHVTSGLGHRRILRTPAVAERMIEFIQA